MSASSSSVIHERCRNSTSGTSGSSSARTCASSASASGDFLKRGWYWSRTPRSFPDASSGASASRNSPNAGSSAASRCPVISALALAWKTKPGGVRSAHFAPSPARAGGRTASRPRPCRSALRSKRSRASAHETPRGYQCLTSPSSAQQHVPIRTVAATSAPYNRRVDPRPVGVFDSGVGGLTVLHECLVTMPHEDFVYLGDHARLPYGPRPLDEIRRFAHEIGGYLEGQGVKLILVACNAATSAGARRAAGGARRARRRRDHAGGARGRAGDAQPPHRAARDAGDGRGGRYARARARARRRRRLSSRSRARGSCR